MYEAIKNGKTSAISEAQARRLLSGNCRDVNEALQSLRGNPFGQLRTSAGTVRFNPNAL